MKRRYWNIRPILVILLSILAALVLLSAFFDLVLCYIGIGLFGLAAVTTGVYLMHAQTSLNRMMRRLARRLNVQDRRSLSALPFAAVCVSEREEILWFNPLFAETVTGSEQLVGQSVDKILPGIPFKELQSKRRVDLTMGDRRYTVMIDAVSGDGQLTYLLYYWDDTHLKCIADEYAASRPAVLTILIDNLDDLFQHQRDSERARAAGQIEKMIEDWIGTTSGIMRKYDAYRFIAVIEQRDLQEMIADKFSIMNRVPAMTFGDISGVTLSIGVGMGEDLRTSQLQSHQAVEMALGRGGDQVAIRTDSGYDFYGGRSQGVERRTKVRTRVVANVIRELLDESESVVVMGHRFSDLDSLGSGLALTHMIRARGKEAFMAVNRKTTLAPELLARYEEAGLRDLIVEENQAVDLMGDGTLLIITDTHSPALLEYESVYRRAKRIVVIDHHRKAVNYIDNATLFYHEPSSSSASEMVAELLPYLLDNRQPDKLDAEALLSGITLDTRGFVMRAGSRTFEAAAYLRRAGADTIAVKKLSAGSIEMYRLKSEIVGRAQPFRNTVIAASDEKGSPLLRVAAAQAADELLSVKGNDASFTLFTDGTTVNISARSYGRFNVQLVMEALGGGGHLMMAAAQLPETTIPEAIERLKTEIDRQLADS